MNEWNGPSMRNKRSCSCSSSSIIY